MTNNEDMVFDSGSGIAVEEQREILSRINGIAEKNRRSLAEGAQGAGGAVKAKKSGSLFPVLVNIAAVFILAVGGFALLYLNGKTDVRIREGNKVYDPAERTLINEIRKETAGKIAAKENEIAQILSRLEDVDAQLDQLYSGTQELTREQLAAQSDLLALQNTYRAELAASREERSQILENSRFREARLRAQLEARTNELTAQRQNESQISAEYTSALAELERLSGEHERAAVLESQLTGGLALINELIDKDRFEQAAGVISDMRLLLSTSAFQSIHSTRKELYTQAINSVESMIDEIRRNRSGELPAATEKELTDLRNKNAQLEETMAASSSGRSGQARRLNELETSVSSLEARSAEKDKTISALQTEKTERDNTISELQARNDAQQREIATLNNQLTTIRQALQD